MKDNNYHEIKEDLELMVERGLRKSLSIWREGRAHLCTCATSYILNLTVIFVF